MGLLDYIASLGDEAKRNLYGLVSDPRAQAYKTVQNLGGLLGANPEAVMRGGELMQPPRGLTSDQAINIALMAQPLKPQARDVQELAKHIKDKYGLAQFNVYKRHDGVWQLADIEVPKNIRKQGIGTAAIRELLDAADDEAARVWLTPALRDPAHGTTSRSRLVEFYKRLGFVENKGRNKDFTLMGGMYREPPKGAK